VRDEFTRTTKENLARRVGHRCSNPNCRQLTSGPQENPDSTINIGVAAHISAASPGGTRYDRNMSSEQRKSIENGMWLCQNCAKLVDNDEERYNVKLLREWKASAEQRALHEIEQGVNSSELRRVLGAALVPCIAVRGKPQPALVEGMVRLRLDVAITSANEVASQEGALKMTVAWPIVFSNSIHIIFRAAHFELSTGLHLEGYDVKPHAQSMMMRWGTSQGTVVFPGDWHNFYGNPVVLDVPSPTLLPNPTYLVQIELFTVKSPTRKTLYFIRPNVEDDFEICKIDTASYSSVAESFWVTYHNAHEKLGR